MLLQKLVEYADRLEEQDELAPPFYKRAVVRYLIELDQGGRLLNPQPIDLSDEENSFGQERPVPYVVRSSNVKPLLLADHAEYTFGLPRDPDNPERANTYHKAYMDLLRQCIEETEAKSAVAVQTFLQADPLSQLDIADDFDRNGKIIFRVQDVFPTTMPDIRNFWAERSAEKYTGGQRATKMQCLGCGQRKTVLEILPNKVMGIPGGERSGAALISANEKAFWSYGLERSRIAPVCVDCGVYLTKALNYLLKNESASIKFNKMAFVFWTRKEVKFNFFSLITDPNPESVRELIRSVYGGKSLPEVDDTGFYALSVSANARVIVRDWIDTTVGQVKASLARWFERQRIVGEWGDDEPRLFGIKALAGATVRKPRKGEQSKMPSSIPRILLRAALVNAPLPWNLLQQAVRRNHAERTVTRPRATLIKLVMTTQGTLKEDEMIQLQSDHPEPAYHCGRLLAVLERIQQAALGNVNATIVDRFYGTASTAPASVFGRLVGGAQPHLSKLRRDRPGTGYALQERLEEVLGALPAFPHTLDLKQQGLFALGYYHQRAHDRAQARAHSRQKAEIE